MEELLNITMGGLLENVAAKYPDVQAVKYIESKFDMTYKEFNAECDEIAKGLFGMGFKKGDHIAIWATNYPEWLVLLFAAAKIGVILVTVNTNYKRAELEYLLKQSDSKGLVVCDGLKDIDCEHTLYELCPELELSQPGALKSTLLPRLKCVISLDNRYRGMFHWSDIKKFGEKTDGKKFEKLKAALSPDDTINMQYTSGTTGFPKGVMLTHKNIINNGKSIGDCMKFSENDRLCIPVPFFHCFGLVLGIMACVTHATTMVPLLFYTPMKVMHTIQYEKCTALHGVPTMYIGMLEHRDFKKYDFSSLRTGIMAGSPCPTKVMREVVDSMNMKEITIAYGQTEASPVCTQTTTDDTLERRVETVGKCLPYMEIKVVDPETGLEVPPNVTGEFCVRGYNVMKGYYNMPDATAKAIDGEGWLHSGDLCTRDEHGYFRITGRIKDMIIRGGENIYPKEVEEFLYLHPKVKDVQVVGVPSKKYVEESVAYIIPKDGQAIDEQEIKDYVNDNMSRHKVPSYVLTIDKFPMTASGKIQKYKLRERAVKELGLLNEVE
jgi:fatty-acyl-CoA synthase